MPFTPFHMGPGIAIKAILQGSFSLMVFGWAQIVMDIQPLIVMITGEGHLHGFTHTYVGATLLAVFSALTGKYLSQVGLYVLGMNSNWKVNIRWWIAAGSAAMGAYSHVLLDSIMHADIEPFYPIATDNQLLGVLSVSALHEFCLYSGLVGSVVFYGISWFQKLKQADNRTV